MQFTKQDIKKISQQLAKTAVKDSQFKEIGSAESMTGTAIPVVKDKSFNVLVPIDKLLQFIDTKLVPGLSRSLSSWIEWAAATLGEPGHDVVANAENVSYIELPTDISIQNADKNVAFALNYIFNVLLGVIPFPTAAQSGDIENVFLYNSYTISTDNT